MKYGRRPQHFQMEDNLNFVIGIFGIQHYFLKIEYDLNFLTLEDDLNVLNI